MSFTSIRILNEQIVRLRNEKNKLIRDNAKVRGEKDKLAQENDKLTQDYTKLKKEFEEFKAKHSVTVDNLRKAMNIKPNSDKSSNHVGAKHGHKGYWRHIPERFDFIKALKTRKCPICGRRLYGESQEVRHRYVTDIKLVGKTCTTRYDIHRKYCPHCKRIVEQKVPNALPHAKIGLNLMLCTMHLKLGLRLPYNKIREYFLTYYNLRITEGGIANVLRQLAREFGDYYAYLEKFVKLARIKHADTTSWRINGKNYNAWVFIAFGRVLYKIRKRNNSRVALSVFGKNQKGNILVIDRFSALRALAEKAGFLLQLCWSHILDDSKQLAKCFGDEGKYVHKRLKEIYRLAKGLNHKGNAEQVEQLKGMIFELTQRHCKHLTVWKFVKNLYYRDVENLFRFVTDPDVDPTNNISERKLRALVIIRKISNCSRSRRGANATAILMSVIETLRSGKKNLLEGLQDILNNPSHW